MSRQDIVDKSKPVSQWFNGKYRVNPVTSKLLQEAVFADGGGWYNANDKTILHLNEKYLLVNKDGCLTYTTDEEIFDSKGFPEKQPPQVKLPKAEIKSLQDEKDSIKWPTQDKSYQEIKLQVSYDSTGKYVVPKEFEGVDLSNYKIRDTSDGFKQEPQYNFNQQEESKMSNINRVVSVKFFDDDAGLKAEHSLVAEYQVTTRVSDAMTVSKVLLTHDVAGDIVSHNKVRAETVDLHILKNTGNKVMLQPVEFEDLRVAVTNI
jgi:hypothetical protein